MPKSWRVGEKYFFMKTIFKIIVMVLFAAFYSCQNNAVSTGVINSISSDGIFSGTIVNDSNRIDSLKVYTDDDVVLGKGAVSSDGKFSLVLTNPILYKISTRSNGLVVSDTSAMIRTIGVFLTYKSRKFSGNINKINFYDSDSVNAGKSFSKIIYSDRTFTIKGTIIHSDIYSSYDSNQKTNYNVIFKKGWNEIVLKIDSFSATSKNLTVVQSLSNNITTDLQWRYVPYNGYFSNHSKTHRIQDVVRNGFILQ